METIYLKLPAFLASPGTIRDRSCSITYKDTYTS